MNTILVQKCPLCGKTSEIEVDAEKYAAWQQGRKEHKSAATHGIQVIFADLSDADRETILSGTHSDCWDALFAYQEEEEESQDPGTDDLTPLPGHVVELPKLPSCDICGKNAAGWDGPTARGSWAYMCSECEPTWHAYPGQTGVGIGQRLVVRQKASS